jgi:hypothetical protein
MLKSVWILLPVAFAASAASAAIYKCQAKDGTALYQNFPCPIDSLGSLPTVAKTAPAERRADAKPVGDEPKIGMTTEEVRAMWGEPTDSLWEEPGVGDRSELWSYGNSRSVRFVKSRVAAIQKEIAH